MWKFEWQSDTYLVHDPTKGQLGLSLPRNRCCDRMMHMWALKSRLGVNAARCRPPIIWSNNAMTFIGISLLNSNNKFYTCCMQAMYLGECCVYYKSGCDKYFNKYHSKNIKNSFKRLKNNRIHSITIQLWVLLRPFAHFHLSKTWMLISNFHRVNHLFNLNRLTTGLVFVLSKLLILTNSWKILLSPYS